MHPDRHGALLRLFLYLWRFLIASGAPATSAFAAAARELAAAAARRGGDSTPAQRQALLANWAASAALPPALAALCAVLACSACSGSCGTTAPHVITLQTAARGSGGGGVAVFSRELRDAAHAVRVARGCPCSRAVLEALSGRASGGRAAAAPPLLSAVPRPPHPVTDAPLRHPVLKRSPGGGSLYVAAHVSLPTSRDAAEHFSHFDTWGWALCISRSGGESPSAPTFSISLHRAALAAAAAMDEVVSFQFGVATATERAAGVVAAYLDHWLLSNAHLLLGARIPSRVHHAPSSGGSHEEWSSAASAASGNAASPPAATAGTGGVRGAPAPGARTSIVAPGAAVEAQALLAERPAAAAPGVQLAAAAHPLAMVAPLQQAVYAQRPQAAPAYLLLGEPRAVEAPDGAGAEGEPVCIASRAGSEAGLRRLGLAMRGGEGVLVFAILQLRQRGARQ